MSTMYVNNIAPLEGTTINVASGNTLYTPGSTIQVLSQTFVENVTGTSTSWMDATSLAMDITPKSTSSKIYITYSFWGQVGTSSHHLGWSLKRTVNGASTQLTSTTYGFNSFYDDNSDVQGPAYAQYLDSPNTTSLITYTPLFISPQGSNVQLANTGRTGVMTLMEIAG